MDYHKLQQQLFEMDPSDPREDLAKLQQAAQGGGIDNVAPVKNYLEESVVVEEGSIPLGIDSIADFAALAGVKLEEGERWDRFKAAAKHGVDNYNTVKALRPNLDKNKIKKPGEEPADSTDKKKFSTKKPNINQDKVEALEARVAYLESVIETLIEADDRKIKPRDPNAQTLNDLRKSGAMGAHKDKKKLAKQGYSKHKGKQYESIKDELWARLNELGKS